MNFSVFFVLCLLSVPFACSGNLLVGYFYNLYKYDPSGAHYPLPPNITDANELLEKEMGPIVSLYDVIVQSFLLPSDYSAGTGKITDRKELRDIREGVLGKKGMKQLCHENGARLVISIGGGGAGRVIPDDKSAADKLASALFDYVSTYGYDGVDIDEENTMSGDTYTYFLDSLLHLFKKKNSELSVSCAIGPLSCCFQARAICNLTSRTSGPTLDWAFLMLYGGLYNNAGFTIPSGSSLALWQDTDGQKLCGIRPLDPQQHGLVSDVGSGACQFIDFALYIHWKAEKLVMGLPSYTSGETKAWFELMEKGYKETSHDDVALMTEFTGGLWIPNADDIYERTQRVLNPEKSLLGVNLDNSGWQSKIMECARNGTYAGATIGGVGFWQVGLEDGEHHELSSAARKSVTDSGR